LTLCSTKGLSQRSWNAVASAAEERIRAVLEALPSGVVAAEAASGHIVYANGAMGRMLGCRLGELLGMTLFDIHPTVDEPRIIAQFEKALRGESNHVTDVPVMRNDGHVFPADVHHTFVEIRRRQCLLGIYTDATERTRAKDALQASETQLRTILSNVNDVVWSMSYPDWMPIYVSASVETLSGLHREELVRSPGLWLEMCSVKGLLKKGTKPELITMAKDKNIDDDTFIDKMLDCFLPGMLDEAVTLDPKWLWPRLSDDKKKVLDFPMAVLERFGKDALVNEPRLTVGTVHSVKGGQSAHVILFPDISLNAAAACQNQDGKESVIRQFYVGMTRCRESLYIARPASGMFAPI